MQDVLCHYCAIVYNGDAYFADTVFHLDDSQKELTDNYAKNLSLFLGDGMFQGIFLVKQLTASRRLATSSLQTARQPEDML